MENKTEGIICVIVLLFLIFGVAYSFGITEGRFRCEEEKRHCSYFEDNALKDVPVRCWVYFEVESITIK